MKKFLALLLALVMCVACFVACNNFTTTDDAADLTEAVDYLKGMYKDSAKDTKADYDVAGKIVIGDATFTVTWTTDNKSITVKESSKAGFYTVDVPDKNETAVAYKLTATVAAADGKTESISFDKNLPVYDSSEIVTKPEAEKAYKFYLDHVSLGQTLYATGETQNDKFLITTTDPKAAPDFFVEADGEGSKFYFEKDGKKMYIKASITVDEASGKVSKFLSYSETEGTTWIYKSEVNAWFTTIDKAEYVIGTYGTYNTMSLSDASYMTVESTGVSQFPAGIIEKATAESKDPAADVVIYKTPAEIVNAAYELDLGEILSAGHTYTLTGTVTDIPSPYDPGYGNATIVIVVEGLTDKPIECFRIKGTGVENVKVGDKITVSGQILKYDNKTETGKVEFNAGCKLEAVNGSAPVVTDKPAQTTAAPVVTNKPTETNKPADTNNTPADTDNTPAGTDNTPAGTTAATPAETTTPEPVTLPDVPGAVSIPEALAAEDGTQVTVVGIVVAINTVYSEQHGNITVTIEDLEGNSLYLYRLKGNYTHGDIITVTGSMATYNAKRQVAAGATAVSNGKYAFDYQEVSIADSLTLPDDTWVIVKGTVKSIDSAWNTQYYNMSITIEDASGTNTIYVYRLLTEVQVGDNLVITGRLDSYHDEKQITQAYAEIK